MSKQAAVRVLTAGETDGTCGTGELASRRGMQHGTDRQTDRRTHTRLWTRTAVIKVAFLTGLRDRNAQIGLRLGLYAGFSGMEVHGMLNVWPKMPAGLRLWLTKNETVSV